MSRELIQVDRLTTGYRTSEGRILRVLHDVSLDMREGEAVGVVGESGCGKTTLGLALMGYLRFGGEVMAGTVRFKGMDMFGLEADELQKIRGKQVALIPQNTIQALTPTMRVGDQIAEVLTVHSGLGKPEARDRVVELLAQMHLPQPELMISRYPHQISGGQLQRVAIAMALASDPDLLVLDEPTTGLDVTTQVHIFELLQEIQERFDTAMLYISHDIGAIVRVSKRLVVMYAGDIVEDGPLAEVLAHPAHPYTRGLMNALPRLTSTALPASVPGRVPSPGQLVVGCPFAPRCSFADETCVTVDPTIERMNHDEKTPHLVRCHYWQRVVSSGEVSVSMQDSEYVMKTEPVLELSDVGFTYNRPGLLDTFLRRLRGKPEPSKTMDDITLTIHKGETLALVGESGCAKTTMARVVAGLLPPCEGGLTYEGHDLAKVVQQRPLETCRKIQIIFQNPQDSLNPRHTVKQILYGALRCYFKLHEEERLQRAVSLLEEVHLTSQYLERYPSQLSGGEKQRVAVARAFAAEPDLVLCDEVVSSLDVSVQAAVLNLLAELQADRGVAYLFITHDLAVVRVIADRVAVLYQGHLTEVGPVEQIYSPPYHPYTETLLAAAPKLVPGVPVHLLAKDVPEGLPAAQGCRFQRRCPRRIGAICDKEPPPWRVAAQGHSIRCHIPLDDLRKAQPNLIQDDVQPPSE